MNKECEHEWIETCNKCGFSKRSANDFYVKENIEQINKQEWEDIWNEYFKSGKCGNKFPTLFSHWLKENYYCPEKKNT